MAFCSKCGTELSDGAKFCPKCGEEVNQQSKSSDNDQPKVFGILLKKVGKKE